MEQVRNTEQEFRTIELCQEDIENLKVAYDKIYKNTTDLHALELFTIGGIIDQFNNGNKYPKEGWVTPDIAYRKDALKKQRENCADSIKDMNYALSEIVRLAPEPEN